MVAHAKDFPIPERFLKVRQQAIESLYCGLMDVYVDEAKEDHTTHITSFESRLLFEQIPCRLSFQSVSSTTKNEPAQADKNIRVHLSKDYEIPAGSIVVITQHGQTETYKCSSRPRHYSTHQIIELEIYEEHA